MKSAEKKVQEFLSEHVKEFTNAQERALITMLKVQDRDTRHACAEAVLQCEAVDGGVFIENCDVFSVCMNAKAV